MEIPKTKNCVPRSFTIIGGMTKIIEKYTALRPSNVKTERFFLNYQRGKCTVQPIGINKLRKNGQLIAEYLKLENPNTYTGHCFRRTSASVLVDAGADITALKRHGGWKSNTVAEGYINDSMLNKNNNAKMIAKAVGLSERSEESTVPKRVKISSDALVKAPSKPQIHIDNLSNEEINLPSCSGLSIHMTNCTNFNIKYND